MFTLLALCVQPTTQEESIKIVSNRTKCEEQPYCMLVNLTTLLHHCKNFFKVPCPNSCGVCSSREFKKRFSHAIDPIGNGMVALDKAEVTLKLLNVSVEDALVTEIKDLLLDSKAVISDTFKLLDTDNSGEVTITELINGLLNFIQSMQVNVKPEFKESIQYIAEIIKISNKGEIKLPKLNDLIRLVLENIGAYPHGLVTFNRLQNMTRHFYNLERMIVTEKTGYSVNTKLLASSVLAKMDRDSDGYVSQSDYVFSLLYFVRQLNVTVDPKVNENLKSYFEIYLSSLQQLLVKYGLNDINLMEGKILPEYDNKPFVNLIIPINEAVQTAKKFPAHIVMRYIRSATNKIPPKKLTFLSIIESSFAIADRNKDGLIDIPEFVYFTVNNLPKDMGLDDMNESIKIIKLFDDNNDDKLSSREFKELLKPFVKN